MVNFINVGYLVVTYHIIAMIVINLVGIGQVDARKRECLNCEVDNQDEKEEKHRIARDRPHPDWNNVHPSIRSQLGVRLNMSAIETYWRRHNSLKKKQQNSRRKTIDVDVWTEANVKVDVNGKDGLIKILETTGKYGYHSPHQNILGKLVHIADPGRNSNLGCNSGIANKHHIPTRAPWIALVKRGQCLFFNKIKLGQLHNASAVVVYNDRDSPTMVMNTVGTNIVSVMVSKKDGERYARIVDSGKETYMQITVGTKHRGPEIFTQAEYSPSTAPASQSRKAAGDFGGGVHRISASYLQVFLLFLLNICLVTLLSQR